MGLIARQLCAAHRDAQAAWCRSVLAGTGLPFVLARMGVDPANAGTSIQARAYPRGFLRPYGAYSMTWEGHIYIWAVPCTYHIYGAPRSKSRC